MSSITDGKTGYVRGPSHATDVFGLGNEALFINNPKTKFEHFVRFNINQRGEAGEFFKKTYPGDEFKYVAALAKSVTYPNITLRTELANQYNKKRHYHTGIDYQPVTVIFHDVADGKSLDFWKMYYQYNFKNGHPEKLKVGDNIDNGVASSRSIFAADGKLQTMPLQSDFLTLDNRSNIIPNTSTHDTYGLNLHNVNTNLLSSIELIFSRAKQYEKVVLVNPTISSFAHDTFNYEDTTGLMTITMTFEYETVIYDQVRPMTSIDSSGAVSKSIARSLPLVKTPNINLKQSAVPTASNVSVGKKTQAALAEENPLAPPLTATAPSGPPTLGQRIAANVQGSFGPLGSQLSKDLVNSVKTGLKTGNFKLTPNPLDTIKTVGTNVLNNQVGIVTGALEGQATQLAINGLASVLTPVIGLASNATAFLAEGATNIAGGIAGSVTEVANSAFSSAASGVQTAVDAANSLGQSPPESPGE